MRKEKFDLPPINADREASMTWWWSLNGRQRIQLTKHFYPDRNNMSLTGREIQKMWVQRHNVEIIKLL